MKHKSIIFLTLGLITYASTFFLGIPTSYAGNCDAQCTNDGIHNPSCPADRDCTLQCFKNADGTTKNIISESKIASSAEL